MCVLKSQTHVSKYRKFQLSADIEKNPGPTPIYIDSCKTITASYSQANELVIRKKLHTELPTVLNVFKTDCDLQII